VNIGMSRRRPLGIGAGRGIGERLAIDPSRNSVLYLGVRGGFGLWRSTDHGASWAQVTSFPNVGNVIPDPNDTTGYSSGNAGVLQTVFDDSGATWTAATLPPDVTGPGVEDQAVAISADGSRVVWAPAGGPVVRSTDGGQTWQACAGLASGTPVRSDRVDPMRFYAYAAGTFYLSTDGAASFAPTAATGSSGSGASFTRLPRVDEGDVVGFGKAAPGRHYPAVFTSAKISKVRGIFRSDDAGRSWVRVNDGRHQYGRTGNTITGDPRVHGRVYVGTNAHGVIVGELT
jgi:photosystem II stability/assembly factor-like uncharacterized protein